MRVLVTGSDGFIGKNLTQYISQVQDTYISTYDIRNGNDILDKNKLRNAICESDLVIHLAGLTNTYAGESEKERYNEVNIQGTRNVIDIAGSCGIKVVYASTCDLYPNSTKPISEDVPLSPKPTVYAQSKFQAEKYAVEAAKFDQKVVVARLFNPYGPNQSTKKLIPFYLRCAIHGQPLPVWGEGETLLDYIYIDDVVSGLWEAKDLADGSVVNICTGKGTTVQEIATYISENYGGYIVHIPTMSTEIRQLVGSPKKMQELSQIWNEDVTGWKAKTPIKEGIDLTFDWYQSRDLLKPFEVENEG